MHFGYPVIANASQHIRKYQQLARLRQSTVLRSSTNLSAPSIMYVLSPLPAGTCPFRIGRNQRTPCERRLLAVRQTSAPPIRLPSSAVSTLLPPVGHCSSTRPCRSYSHCHLRSCLAKSQQPNFFFHVTARCRAHSCPQLPH